MRPRMAPRKMTEERISRISASGTSQPVGAEASTTTASAPLPLRPAAQVPEDVQGGRHVGQLRAVVDDALARGQKAGRQNGQYAVFCPVYPHRAVQGVSPLDDVSTHRSSLRKSFGTLSYAEGGRLVQLARFSIKRTRVW